MVWPLCSLRAADGCVLDTFLVQAFLFDASGSTDTSHASSSFTTDLIDVLIGALFATVLAFPVSYLLPWMISNGACVCACFAAQRRRSSVFLAVVVLRAMIFALTVVVVLVVLVVALPLAAGVVVDDVVAIACWSVVTWPTLPLRFSFGLLAPLPNPAYIVCACVRSSVV